MHRTCHVKKKYKTEPYPEDTMAPRKKVDTWKWTQECSLEGYSVVVACVSVGNVAQLAGDLLVTSLAMRRVATLHSAALVPVCGADPYSLTSPELCTSADLYASEAVRTAVLQVRAPLVARRADDFLKEVVSTLKNRQVGEIVILTSSFAHEKHQVMTSSFRYVTNDLFKRSLNPAWLKHDKVNDELVIYGGGFATRLFEICTNQAVPAMILFKYCSEGDNIPDAHDVVAMLARLLPLFPEQAIGGLETRLKEPVSWRLLFGGPPPMEIY